MNPQKFLNIAKSDLESSIILYKHGHFPQAVFSLQQSVEKAAKAFGISTNLIPDKKNLMKIKHKPMRIYLKIGQNLDEHVKYVKEAQKKEQKVTELLDLLEYDIDAVEEGVNELHVCIEDSIKHTSDYRYLSKEEINEIIELIAEYEMDLETVKENMQREISEDVKIEWKERILELNTKVANLSDEISKEWKTNEAEIDKLFADPNFIENFIDAIKPLWDLIVVFIELHFLSYITQPHAVDARYCDVNFDPLEFYTNDLPLIQALPIFQETMEKTIIRMENRIGGKNNISINKS